MCILSSGYSKIVQILFLCYLIYGRDSDKTGKEQRDESYLLYENHASPSSVMSTWPSILGEVKSPSYSGILEALLTGII